MDGLFIEDSHGNLIPNPEYDNDYKGEKYTQLEMEL